MKNGIGTSINYPMAVQMYLQAANARVDLSAKNKDKFLSG